MAPTSGDKSHIDSTPATSLSYAARRLLGNRKLIVAANRGPLSFTEDHTGQLAPRSEPSRGFEQFEAFSDVEISWVTGAVSAADRKAADTLGDPAGLIQNDVLPKDWATRFVSLPRRVHHKFYNVICNPLLWFMLHRSWSPTFTPNIGSDEHDAWERGYKAVNESFATTVVELAGDEEIALLCRDYQLMLVSGYVRKQRPTAIIHQSFETPWPWPSDFEILPSNWRYELLHSLLLADVISFSSNQDIDAFIACAKSTLGDEIRVEDSKSQHLSFGDHQIQLTVSPPPVRSSRFKLVAEFEATQRAISQLNEWSGQHTFVTVDRAEPHKNIVRSINAFGELLKKQPELTNDVRFLLYLTPGPAHISAYKRLLEEIRRSARRVNDRSNGVNPVHIREDGNFSRAVAALATYDTLVSVPLVDGTGRSILDGPLVNTKQGGMILSETTAAAELLADQVSLVGFSDVAAMASAMSDAVAEDSSSRKNKSDDTRRTIENLVGATDSGQPIYEIIERLIETVD